MTSEPDPSPDRRDDSSPADEPDPTQDAAARRSRQTGGDAPAAASIEEREAVSEDRDELFDDDGDDDGESEDERG